jgi:hypothetical protein
MPITINGSGPIGGVTTLTNLDVGGLPNGVVTAADLDGAQTGSAPIYGARAWVTFNGTGTPAIRASGNVSSITDNGTGNYTVNFTTAMADTNYAVFGGAPRPNFDNSPLIVGTTRSSLPTTSSIRIITMDYVNNLLDPEYVYVAIFR